MKANELRLGNLINFPFIGTDVEVIGLALKSEGTLYVQSRFNKKNFFESPEKYKPIPLTEEWLVKFGFENGYKQYDYMNWGMQVSRLYGSDNMFICSHGFYTTFSELKSIRYVHELQNIFYSLSNEELTLKQ